MLRTFQRLTRQIKGRLLAPTLEVVSHQKYNASFPNVPNDPLRAERILAFLAAEKLVPARACHRPRSVSLKALERVHDVAYLDSLHDTATLSSIMGTDITADQVDRLVDLQRLATGGTLLATRLARSRDTTVVHLGGGFHHAHAQRGEGFCLFNDVAVAIARERSQGFRGKVLVIDLDLHDGNGTREIFAADPDVYTFSIHARHWSADEAISSTSIELGEGVNDDTYLRAVHRELTPVCERFSPDLVIYLAGADPAREDPLGDWRITPRGMLRRDLFVTRLIRSRARIRPLPLVILLAGGYSLEAWRYTARFLAALVRGGRPIEPPSTQEMTMTRYRHISSLLTAEELSGAGANEFGLSEDDLFLPSWGMTKETRFLGFYSRMGIELIFERSGFFDRLRDLGFKDLTLELTFDHPNGHTLRVFDESVRNEPLVELRVRRDRGTIAGMELLYVDWLLMQNPRAGFSAARRPLPGQAYPGLGLLNDLTALLALACERLGLDGLVFVPAQYHVARYGYRRLRFLDPHARAHFEALRAALHGLPFAAATRAVADGQVIDAATGETVKWQPAAMVLAISPRLETHLAQREKEAAPTQLRYVLRPLEV